MYPCLLAPMSVDIWTICLNLNPDEKSWQLNEGTSFSTSLFGLGLSGSAEVAAFEQFVKASQIDESKITQDTLDEIVQAYPANTEQMRFSTGDSLFDRAATWYCDNMFLAPRRRFTAVAAKLQPVFTYFFTEFVPGDSPKLGGTWAFARITLQRIRFQTVVSFPCF